MRFSTLVIAALAGCGSNGSTDPSQSEASSSQDAAGDTSRGDTSPHFSRCAPYQPDGVVPWIIVFGLPSTGSDTTFPILVGIAADEPVPEAQRRAMRETFTLFSEATGTDVAFNVREQGPSPEATRQVYGFYVEPVDPTLRGRFRLRVGPVPDRFVFGDPNSYVVCGRVAETYFDI